MNRKAGFDMRTYLVAFLIVCGIMITYGTLATLMASDYASLQTTPVVNQFENTQEKLDQIVVLTKDEKDQLDISDVGTQDSDTQVYSSTLKATKIIIPSVSIFNALIQDAANIIGVPQVWITIAGSVLFVSILTAIIFMIFKPS